MDIITQNFKNFKYSVNFHFIGIGGVSMSSLALILKQRGKSVQGSDSTKSDMTEMLEKQGIKVYIGHKSEYAAGADMVVYTAAIADNNPELVYAKENNIPIVERSVLLGMLMSDFKKSIAVAGTHGKTTTTSIMASVFLEGGDPTVLVGARLSILNGNYRVGKSDISIYEACEYVNSFHNFYPDTAVILNIDEDHLDFFKDLETIRQSFIKFTQNICKGGRLIINGDDPNCRYIIDNCTAEIITFGLEKTNDCYANNIVLIDGMPTFDVIYKGEFLCNISMSVIGHHNILNALSVICAATQYGIGIDAIKSGIKNFTGADRRFQIRNRFGGIVIVDDYAHHPTEIKATLEGASSAGFKNIYVIFQPHTYTRTHFLMDDFAAALSIADHVILTDIYSAREINTVGVNILNLKDKIDGSIYISDFEEIAQYIRKTAKMGDLVILMGAGDVNKIAELI